MSKTKSGTFRIVRLRNGMFITEIYGVWDLDCGGYWRPISDKDHPTEQDAESEINNYKGQSVDSVVRVIEP